jgi:hypothetical protein
MRFYGSSLEAPPGGLLNRSTMQIDRHQTTSFRKIPPSYGTRKLLGAQSDPLRALRRAKALGNEFTFARELISSASDEMRVATKAK